MARLDPATAKFAATLADDDKTPLDPLKAARAVIRFAENPQRGVAKAIVRATMEKAAGLSPTKTFERLNKEFGREWWDWEPETIWASLHTFGLEATPELRNLVMALQCTVNSNAPFEHWHVFEKVGLAFNLHQVDFGVVQQLEPNEASFTIYMLKTIRPREEFEPEVLGYVAAVCHDAGMAYLPRELFTDGAQHYLEVIAPDESGVGKSTGNSWVAGGSAGQTGGSSELPVLTQLAMLREIKDYVGARL